MVAAVRGHSDTEGTAAPGARGGGHALPPSRIRLTYLSTRRYPEARDRLPDRRDCSRRLIAHFEVIGIS